MEEEEGGVQMLPYMLFKSIEKEEEALILVLFRAYMEEGGELYIWEEEEVEREEEGLLLIYKWEGGRPLGGKEEEGGGGEASLVSGNLFMMQVVGWACLGGLLLSEEEILNIRRWEGETENVLDRKEADASEGNTMGGGGGGGGLSASSRLEQQMLGGGRRGRRRRRSCAYGRREEHAKWAGGSNCALATLIELIGKNMEGASWGRASSTSILWGGGGGNTFLYDLPRLLSLNAPLEGWRLEVPLWEVPLARREVYGRMGERRGGWEGV